MVCIVLVLAVVVVVVEAVFVVVVVLLEFGVVAPVVYPRAVVEVVFEVVACL